MEESHGPNVKGAGSSPVRETNIASSININYGKTTISNSPDSHCYFNNCYKIIYAGTYSHRR